MIDKNLPKLLHRISDLVKKYQEIEDEKREYFNIFNVMRVESDEVKTHSAIISELLNPKGSHKYGNIFLKLFLEEIEEIFSTAEYGDLHKTKVTYEKSIGRISEDYTEGGRIDILIEHPKFEICIENKINAGDQPFQLRRYHNFLSKKNKKTLLLYLTLDGNEADVNSICDSENIGGDWRENYDEVLIVEKDYYCISYRNELFYWLEKCYKISTKNTSFSSVLKQYIDIIKQLINTMNTEEISELKNILGENNNSSLAKKIIDNWIYIRRYTEFDFWNNLEKLISKKYTILDLQKFSGGYLDGAIWSSRNRYLDYGFHFIIKETEKYNICLSIERGSGNVFYGISLRKKGSNEWLVNEEYFEYYFKLIEQIDDDFDKTENWVAYKDFLPEINFEHFSNETTLKLTNSKYCKELTFKYWSEIENFIKNFLSKLND